MQNKNLIDKKFIFVLFQFKETGNWCLLIFENFYCNFSQELYKKHLASKKTKLNEQSKLKLLYFQNPDENSPNFKEIKNAVVNKLQEFFSNYLVNKYKIKYENCFKSERYV